MGTFSHSMTALHVRRRGADVAVTLPSHTEGASESVSETEKVLTSEVKLSCAISPM